MIMIIQNIYDLWLVFLYHVYLDNNGIVVNDKLSSIYLNKIWFI